jgi:arylformamidase
MTDWIDITHMLHEDMPQWPGDPPYQLRRVEEITGPGTANLSQLSTSVHIGTHVDAPLHYFPTEADVAALPLEKLCGPALVVHVTAPRDIEVADLEPAGIKSGDRVLLRTANEALREKRAFDEGFFGLTGQAARWLADRGVVLVGIDYFSVDNYREETRPAHYALLGKGVVVIEGLDLAGVAPGRYELVALPLKMAGSEGSPARVIIRPLSQHTSGE